MILTFLESSVPLTKSYSKNADGTLNKSSYPHVYEVTSIEEDCPDLLTFERLLRAHAAKGHCLLKGNPTRTLNCESRAGTTDSSAATDWVCLDIDGLDNVKDVPTLLGHLGLSNVSYVLQWSASYGIESNALRCHIFMQLDKPYAAPLLKQWLISMNHSIAILRDAITLTKTGNSLHWPLDISACQNDKLLYIAPPVFKGIKDPMAKKPRIQYVVRNTEFLTLTGTISAAAKNRELTNKLINEIRAKEGLPERKVQYKMHGNMEVMVKPDSCVISDMRIERGFVYFNLNGGDSWAYYHPENNPDYIHNFKGEPVYLTKELLPEYWQQLTQSATRTNSQGLTYLAFCDRKTGTYWRGTYDTQNDILDLNQAKNETQIRHFAKQHGMPLGDYIPEWDIVFDPHDSVRVDAQHRVVNMFQPTQYMQAPARKVTVCPKTIFKVIHHALGSSDECTEHFMNWLAYIIQFRDRTRTAWVLHGTQGTGKGLLMNNILRPLFGFDQATVRQMNSLSEPYNEYVQNALIVFVDEVQVKALNNEAGIMAKIKNWISEETIGIRRMYANTVDVRNYSNWIFASNMPDPVIVDKNDRRFNVGRYQPVKLDITDAEIEGIKKELQAFHNYLLYYAVDKLLASTPLQSEDRDNLVSLSEASPDRVASALLEGDFEFLLDELPTTDHYVSNALEYNRVENYMQVLHSILDRTKRDNGKCNLSRDELRTIFDYTVGNIPSSPNKFTAYLGHRRIHITKVWIVDRTVNGMIVLWKDIDRFDEYESRLRPKKTNPVKDKK